ncbi:hypothetical protein FDO65_04295 [Nakamurella flava]|uniref:Uncharacterized protein n=1 Tax=Nakamurella flava TaxID=2576308 RepID=A0A4U6QKS5_9ACTN|nr:hypothetical protein [Nakamurella flava]TKV60889.1 hypothetical protein FDO65_04295 [Nakamurella flava]
MKARTTGLTGVMAAGALLLAACGSGGGTAATTSAGAPLTTSAVSTTSASAAPSSSAGGDVQLDGQTISWFTTLCSGLTSLNQLQGTGSVTSTAQLGTLLTSTGDAINQTNAALAAKPAPTFDGGEAFAAQADKALGTFGATLTEFGQRASALPAGDQAAATQFAQDFQAAAANFNSLGAGVKLDPAIEKAVVAQAPGCDVLASTVGAGRGSSSSATSAAPTS